MSLPRLWNESGATVTQMKIQTHLSKSPLIKLEMSAFDLPHTLSISKPCLALLFKTKSIKDLHFSGMLYFPCPFSSFQIRHPNITSTLCLAVGIQTTSFQYTDLSYHISAITYRHEWAAGRPSFAQDPTAVSPPRWQWQSGASKFVSSKAVLFPRCRPQCRTIYICQPLRLRAINETSQ